MRKKKKYVSYQLATTKKRRKNCCLDILTPRMSANSCVMPVVCQICPLYVKHKAARYEKRRPDNKIYDGEGGKKWQLNKTYQLMETV